jgi:hypothetical protein
MIYLDLDGVLADFNGYIETLSPGCLDSREKTREVILEHYKECFRKSEVLEKNVKFLEPILRGRCGEFKILTALPGKSFEMSDEVIETLKQNKLYWLKKHFDLDEDKVIIARGIKGKFEHLKEGDILYDDNIDTVKKCLKLGIYGIYIKSDRLKDRKLS